MHRDSRTRVAEAADDIEALKAGLREALKEWEIAGAALYGRFPESAETDEAWLRLRKLAGVSDA